jgi:hypothetical protein
LALISELSVHGHLALALGLWWHSTSWQEHEAEELTHFMVTGKPRKNEECTGSQYLFQGHASKDLTSFY